MSSRRQGVLPKLSLPAEMVRRGINLWPPFVGAGVRVTRIAADFRELEVRLRLGILNRNYFGTHFGGSRYAMTDPFYALMMVRNLGPDYVVWDKAGSIHYVKPARGDVFARFRLPASAVARARAATANGARHEPTFAVRVVDVGGDTVATVAKTLYVRRRPEADARPEATRPKAPARARTRSARRTG